MGSTKNKIIFSNKTTDKKVKVSEVSTSKKIKGDKSSLKYSKKKVPNREHKLPETGENKSLLITTVGLLSLISLSLFVYLKKKKIINK